ncbi:phenylacetaldoxime dehydratase family protein [uncultured Ruegeria sp.]|uniref:phenylacetaldoxime dehydratase family protein n=1 Tax=uncultured Ruegeria sp. TaxID=259304 RepID=UPI002622226B|nr:phenylacetaldoxime dehydratase family protein [uncultured Ruegeria sp.]
MNLETSVRKFPMRKPKGHAPMVQRYSSELEESVRDVRVAVFGKQSASGRAKDFIELAHAVLDGEHRPAHFDFARFTDPEGYINTFVVAYWLAPDTFSHWRSGFDQWWASHDATVLDYGLWFETFSVPTPYRETIAFKEYIRGLSACPYSKIKPMDESAYWGAARDRFAASAYDTLGPTENMSLEPVPDRQTFGQNLRVTRFPKNLCMIRSGVSWEACGNEQLQSYRKNLAPKLDAGMDFLRKNPTETGCASLRQVTYLDETGSEAAEAYSMGFFLSFKDLEDWAEHHPTHLAIYTRALAERAKYQEDLELRTYHEIYVLNEAAEFLYLNCQPKTGLLPYFQIVHV